ncbi:MAG: hypothetical protein AB7R40_23865 [Nitrospiraceae bacterium]
MLTLSTAEESNKPDAPKGELVGRAFALSPLKWGRRLERIFFPAVT